MQSMIFCWKKLLVCKNYLLQQKSHTKNKLLLQILIFNNFWIVFILFFTENKSTCAKMQDRIVDWWACTTTKKSVNYPNTLSLPLYYKIRHQTFYKFFISNFYFFAYFS